MQKRVEGQLSESQLYTLRCHTTSPSLQGSDSENKVTLESRSQHHGLKQLPDQEGRNPGTYRNLVYDEYHGDDGVSMPMRGL